MSVPDTIGPWAVGKLIGRGTYGAVYHGEHMTGTAKDRAALKIFDDAAEAKHEALMLRNIRHPHIVRYLGLYELPGGRACIATRLIHGVTIDRLVRHRRLGLPIKQIRRYAAHLLTAVHHLHTHGIGHRDIKTDNIIVDLDADRAVIIDLGFAEFAPSIDARSEVRSGTKDFAAPELSVHSRTGILIRPLDVYALGVTLFYAATRLTPRRWMRRVAKMKDDKESVSPFLMLRQAVLCESPALLGMFIDVMRHMLETDPHERWSVCKLVEHPFFAMGWRDAFTPHTRLRTLKHRLELLTLENFAHSRNELAVTNTGPRRSASTSDISRAAIYLVASSLTDARPTTVLGAVPRPFVFAPNVRDAALVTARLRLWLLENTDCVRVYEDADRPLRHLVVHTSGNVSLEVMRAATKNGTRLCLRLERVRATREMADIEPLFEFRAALSDFIETFDQGSATLPHISSVVSL